jgi:hypothetical protein
MLLVEGVEGVGLAALPDVTLNCLKSETTYMQPTDILNRTNGVYAACGGLSCPKIESSHPTRHISTLSISCGSDFGITPMIATSRASFANAARAGGWGFGAPRRSSRS